MAQLHKKFTDSQIKELIIKFLNKEIERDYIQNKRGRPSATNTEAAKE